MKLRQLDVKDAYRMLEWMHDPFVVGKLRTDFSAKKIDDCISFIKSSIDDNKLNLAITDNDDLYMGTVSLRDISDSSAEFAITVCKDAMGKGFAKEAMSEIIRIGFLKYKLKTIYWCVAKDNLRALRFYDKNGYKRVMCDAVPQKGKYTKEQFESYVWYLVSNEGGEYNADN